MPAAIAVAGTTTSVAFAFYVLLVFLNRDRRNRIGDDDSDATDSDDSDDEEKGASEEEDGEEDDDEEEEEDETANDGLGPLRSGSLGLGLSYEKSSGKAAVMWDKSKSRKARSQHKDKDLLTDWESEVTQDHGQVRTPLRAVKSSRRKK